MGLINPTYDDRIKYTLQNKEHGSLIITEPIGWRNDEKEYARHKKYHGIFAKFSNSLKFIDNGADFIKLVFDLYGVNAEIRLTRDEQHPHTDVWVRSYDGFLDLSTYSVQDRKASIKFNSSGLAKLLKTRESEKVEIERTDTLDGNSLPPFRTKIVQLDGRQIFLKTIYEIENSNNNSNIRTRDRWDTRGHMVCVPLHLLNKSHENASSTFPNVLIDDNSYLRNADGETGLMFFENSDKDRTLKIKFNLSFKILILEYDDIEWSRFYLRLATYRNGSDYKYKSAITLFYVEDIYNYHNQILNFPFNQTIYLLEGESLSLQFTQLIHGETWHNATLDVDCTEIKCDLSIEEDSFADATSSKMILAHELGDRLTEIITNRKDVFYSDILGRTDIGYSFDGKASLTGHLHGHWVRGFDKYPINEENKYKALTTSFKDYMENLSVIWNIGLGIEKIGFRERIRVEKLEYFYKNNVTIKLPNQVKKLKRSVAKEFYFSGLELGYTKGGEYEEAMGLDEYNAKSTFTTAINSIKKIYRKISKYRADTYGMEFARRKPKAEFPTEDTRYDKDIFLLDLKRWHGDIFKKRKWQDDFSQPPTGTFSPETATNLRFSPFNILLRHGWIIASGLAKYPTARIRYGSSTANSYLATKLIGGYDRSENGNIINSELKRARFLPEWIEFEHVVNFETMQQVEGFTTISGEKTPNFYGLVQFINEDNEIEKGYLFNLKPNGNGKWKLLKANR